MKRFIEVMSPISWLVSAAGLLPVYFLVFRPTLFEFAICVLVDGIAMPIFSKIASETFLRRYPEAHLYIGNVKSDAIRALSFEEKRSLFQSITSFPERWAKHAFFRYFY
jgi:hypothetical protein